jgi:predicted acylesterase/phospholipase RssA
LPGIECHAGAWLAFEEAGLRPRHVTGCSAGALVSALQASGMAAADGLKVLRSFDADWLVNRRTAWKARALLGDLESIADPSHIEGKLADLLPPRFDDLRIPLTVAATRMDQDFGSACSLEAGALRTAVMASMSIPGVWPYCLHHGQPYSDGGTTSPFPLPGFVDGFTAVVVVEIASPDFIDRDKNVISRLLWCYEQCTRSWKRRIKAAYSHYPNIHWLTLDPGDGSCLDWSPKHAAIADAHDAAKRFLLLSGLLPKFGLGGPVRTALFPTLNRQERLETKPNEGTQA